jgi:uncharacterized membrane protein
MSQLTALAVTLAIECPLVFGSMVRRRRDLAWTKLLSISVLPSCITHPWLWMATSLLPSSIDYYWGIFGLEFLVVVAEGYFLKFLFKRSLTYGLLISFIANGASVLVGLWMWRVFW